MAKKTNFLEQLQGVQLITSNATKFIETAPIKKGQAINLFAIAKKKNKQTDINDMPTVTRVDKYNNYDEFGVIAVSNKDGVIQVHLEGKGEAGDEKKVFPATEFGNLYMLDDYNTCLLADLISENLK